MGALAAASEPFVSTVYGYAFGSSKAPRHNSTIPYDVLLS